MSHQPARAFRLSSNVFCRRLIRSIPILVVLACLAGVAALVQPPDVRAIPAFARKYNVSCATCHTRFPRLNTYGERFLENGYQLPGTEDGGIANKTRFGDVSLDDVKNYMAFRINGNVVRSFSYYQRGSGADGSPQSRTELTFPSVFSMFTAGTLARNVGFFAEVESNLEESKTGPERIFLTFNNVGGHDLAHLRVGRFDPSAFFSFATLRQHLTGVGADVSANGTVNRVALTPYAFAAKFSGLLTRDGSTINPYDPALFNANSEVGADFHGRPFGDWFLYQVGVVNGAHEKFGDSNNVKDWYVMARVDYARSQLFSASLSGFAYFGSNNAKVSSQADVDWSRHGIAANIRYKMIDLYGAYIIDRISHLPQSMAQNFDTTATGVTIEADALVTDRALLSIRYDHLDAGGLLDQRKSSSILGLQAKYYLRSNLALSARNDVNLRASESGTNAARNFRNAFFIGADVAF